MKILACFVAACIVAALLSGIVAAFAQARVVLREAHPGAPVVTLPQLIGATMIFLLGLAGAAVGMIALAMALEVAP